MAEFSRAKIWGVFGVLFVCGALVGVGIANWGHATKAKRAADVAAEQQAETGSVSKAIAAFIDRERAKDAGADEKILTACETIEKVLLARLADNDQDCDSVKRDLNLYKKLATYGCDKNQEAYKQEIDNKNAILDVACDGYVFEEERYNGFDPDTQPCEKIERKLLDEMPWDDPHLDADKRINRAKAYAIMAERGCPEHAQKYTDMARKELEIARGISDDALSEGDTIEVVETYKRLKMQQTAEEVINKVKKMTNPAIDFIIELERIINE